VGRVRDVAERLDRRAELSQRSTHPLLPVTRGARTSEEKRACPACPGGHALRALPALRNHGRSATRTIFTAT
jgi:hypothetical protein